MKKKKKYRLKKGRIIIAISILMFFIFIIFNLNNIISFISLKNLNYQNDSIKYIIKNDLKIDKYSEVFDKIITTSYFNEENVEYYLEIEYHDRENYFKELEELINLGYNDIEINTIYKKIDDINLILNSDYKNNILSILNNDYYKKDNIERYLNYNSNNIVLDVNMNLDYNFYEHDIIINEVNNLVIVNKYYKLDDNYKPDLVKINPKYAINGNQLLTKEAKEAFEKMCEDAKKENIYLYSGSAYRSYSYQNTLYNNRVKQNGLEYANKTAAKAGYSEHQTGLAIDILNGNFAYIDSEDKEYNWLLENSYKYGFILRYPKDKEHITGYTFEPWHFRYLQTDIAKYLKDNNITYEEYIGMKS